MVNRTDELNRPARPVSASMNQTNTDDPTLIRRQIERTRAHMGETIEQIQDRLSPGRLRQQAGETIREATIGKVEQMTNKAEYEVKSWRSKLMRTIKENPIPAALIGIGVGWLVVSDSNGDEEYDSPYEMDYYYHTPAANRYVAGDRRMEGQSRTAEMAQEGRQWARDRAEEVRDRASEVADKVQDRASSITDSIQESARETREQVESRAREFEHEFEETAANLQTSARRTVERTTQTFWETMNENPLAVGAATLAVGAIVGSALPGTPIEDRWMGGSRDQLVEEVKDKAQETAHKVQSVAEEVAETAVETVKEETEKQNLSPRSTPE